MAQRTTALIKLFVVEQRNGEYVPDVNQRRYLLIGMYNQWRREDGRVCLDPREIHLSAAEGFMTVMYDEVVPHNQPGFQPVG